MSKESTDIDPELISSYYDRLLTIQTSIRELQTEYQQLMKDADVDGLERKALNALISLVVNESKPRSEKLLNSLIDYGRHAGYAIYDSGAPTPIAAELSPLNTFQVRDSTSSSNLTGPRQFIGERTKIALQILLGLVAGSTFIWLLH